MSKVNTFIWFVKHPRLYPQMMRHIVRRLRVSETNALDISPDASEWCDSVSISTNDALLSIMGRTPDSFDSLFAKDLINARMIIANCPAKMGGAGNMQLLYWLCEYQEARSVIETGVAAGWSSLAILLSLSNRADSRLVSTDMPFMEKNYEVNVGCVVPERLKKSWKILKYADREALPKATGIFNRIDLCHYDSDKSYSGRMWAYPILWASLREGGIFVSDDIGDNFAFRDFSLSVRLQPVVVKYDSKYVGILIKSP